MQEAEGSNPFTSTIPNMKTIGLIGGMSWESTLEYYRIINELIKEKLGGHNSAKILLYSFNFQEIMDHRYELPLLADKLSKVAQLLEKAGAECLLLCVNTLHVFADDVQSRVSIPILNIIDAIAQEVKNAGLMKVGLLGTQFTMEEEFYKGRLSDRHEINIIIPEDSDRKAVHDIIYNELCLGQFRDSSKELILGVIRKLKNEGAQGVILGCTELPLIIKKEDTDIMLFDTTSIHARLAVRFALTT
jgi:aspartate racemase